MPLDYGWSGELWFAWPLLLGLLVLVVILLLRGGPARSRYRESEPIERAPAIVDRRYAAGEITKEQHAEMKRVLKG